MKKQRNRLIKGKKSRILIWVCFVISLTGLGMLAGCSAGTKKDIKKGTENEVIKFETNKNDDTENMNGQSKGKEDSIEHVSVDQASDDNHTLEDTAMLTFMKEGEQEQKQAQLQQGNGYVIYLPVDEWKQTDSGLWTAAVNEQVMLWVEHFEDESIESIDQELEDKGYLTVQDHDKRKQEGDIIYHAGLKAFDNDLWGIFYCYPADSEEGWGRELPVIVDTFALSAKAEYENNNRPNEAGNALEAEDCQKIRNIVDEFAAAYFDGNAAAIQKILADTYEGKFDVYESEGTVSDWTIKGLDDVDEKKIENDKCVVSLEFRDSSYEDQFLYLTVELIRQEDCWKIQFYGVEG